MKKLLTILLSVLMVLGITGTAVFADEKPLGGDADVTIEVIGNDYMTDATHVDESKVDKVYAVDIAWGSGFNFTYKFNQNAPNYSSETLKYTQEADANEGWYAGDAKGNSIAFSVTNKSNDSVKVIPSFTDVNLTGTTLLEISDANTNFASTKNPSISFELAKASEAELNKAGTAVKKELNLTVSGIPEYAKANKEVRAKVHLDIVSEQKMTGKIPANGHYFKAIDNDSYWKVEFVHEMIDDKTMGKLIEIRPVVTLDFVSFNTGDYGPGDAFPTPAEGDMLFLDNYQYMFDSTWNLIQVWDIK